MLALVRQALSSTDRGYDLLAPSFEYTPFRTPQGILDAVANELDGPVSRAVDVGCGTGAALRTFRPLVTQELIGVDRSAGMLAEAARLSSEGGCPVRWVQGDALRLPRLLGRPVELAFSFGAFGHILPADQPAFVRAIFDALLPGGRFVFVATPRLGPSSRFWWFAHAFNGVMRVRNALLRPPFIMYYLQFSLERATALLTQAGFELEVRRGVVSHEGFELCVVIATRP